MISDMQLDIIKTWGCLWHKLWTGAQSNNVAINVFIVINIINIMNITINVFIIINIIKAQVVGGRGLNPIMQPSFSPDTSRMSPSSSSSSLYNTSPNLSKTRPFIYSKGPSFTMPYSQGPCSLAWSHNLLKKPLRY